MSAIRVIFKCGHQTTLDATERDPPVCAVCGERQIANVQAPRPRFTGAAQGPLVEKDHAHA